MSKIFTFGKTTLGNLFSPPVTKRYPVEPVHHFEKTTGHIVCNIDECILCGICQKSCPASAILVDKAQRTWQIDPFRCVTCQNCVRKCPKSCLSNHNDYTAPATKQSWIVLHKKEEADTAAS
jgi:ech hydrogenase subunit F